MAAIIAGSALIVGAMVGAAHYTEAPFVASWLGYCDGLRYLSDCEYPASLDWVVGAATALLFGLLLAPLVRLAPRRVRPSIYCRGCNGMGWIQDLDRTEGRCPRCGSVRFDYEETTVEAVYHYDTGYPVGAPRRVTQKDVAGPDLLQRLREKQRKSGKRDQ
jgi:hypothetical protein